MNRGPYILAHDLGTTGNKATLFDTAGTVVASAVETYETDYPHPNWAEQDPADWQRAVFNATRKLLEASAIDAGNVSVVSFSGHMQGALLVDRDGAPLRAAIIWADQRATEQADRIRRLCGESTIYRRTGHRVSAAYTAAKVLWIKEHQPEIYRSAYKVLQSKDYAAFLLTGVFATDYSDASGTQVFDLEQRRWAADVLQELDLRAGLFPDAQPSTTIVGHVTREAAAATGLLAGTPVVIGGGDGACATVGAGSIAEGDAYSYIGSSAWIALTTRRPIFDPQQRTFTFAHLDPALYFPIGTMQAAGGARDWLLRILDSDDRELDGAVAQLSPGAGGLLFLPYLLGERSPHWNPHARGAFVGLAMPHDRATLTGAVLEGVALNLRWILDTLLAQGVRVDAMRLIGGGARSPVWRQILADVYGLPILRLSLDTEATALGAAIAGGIGVGLFENFEVARDLVPASPAEQPEPGRHERYAALYEIFQQTYAALEPIYERLASLSESAKVQSEEVRIRKGVSTMSPYSIPELSESQPLKAEEVLLVANGDLRLSANQVCWPAQAEMEEQIRKAFAAEGVTVRRVHAYDPRLEHGFIWNQRMGMDVFKKVHPDAPLVVAEAVWQYSHHLLAGLRDHRGPILTVANWSGQWPGLVGLLNLNGCLTKMGVPYSTIWSEDFTDDFFLNGIRQWLKEGRIAHDTNHVRDLDVAALPAAEVELGQALAKQLRREKAILGVFDEGCMGMYNAIIDDELINSAGLYKERLSQSALVAEMREVSDDEAQAVRDWLNERGVTFVTGPNPERDLTDDQILEQCKMYIAALRIADDFGCDAVGIQYQQGLKDMAPASDLAEGLLNNVERPPVYGRDGERELYPGQPLPHFNEVDEGAGVDALVTNRVWTAMGLDPATTLHDLRWGEWYSGDSVDDFVWVFEISGAAPASHFIDGYAGARSERQPPMYFRLGGGTLKGVSKPGEIVWSRIFVMDGELHADLGRATVVKLPDEETERRWQATTPQWPIMHAVLHGVTRDQMMARHQANHLNVAYAPSAEMSEKALAAKAAMLDAMGVTVHLCGDV